MSVALALLARALLYRSSRRRCPSPRCWRNSMTTQSKWTLHPAALAALVAVTAACSKAEKSDDKMTVQGTVSQALVTTDVQAVAIGEDGRSFWSALDGQRDFKLSVPIGQAYRIVLARRGSD